MPSRDQLFVRSVNASEVPRGLPLVMVMTGFTDAGSAIAQVIEVLREEVPTETLLSYSNDVLLDYRARRPIITFNEDHLSGYQPPRLELSLAHDLMGEPFLTLTGYEPDFAWEAFATSVVDAIEEFGVSSVTWVHSIAMPVPHTRPISTTVSGTRHDLIQAHSVWRPHTQVPATIGHLLEVRFTELGLDVASFVLLVPHYLADSEYPAAALTALESISLATGLVFPAEALRESNRAFLAKVQEQIAENSQLGEMVQNLEERYDQYMAGSPGQSAVLGEYDIPSADELAAELERFLATRPADDDKRGGSLS